MEIKVAVIGAGMSGLAIAKMLAKEGKAVTVFERESRVGGLIKCQRVNNHLFHQTGGHVFNTKYPEVAEWFWSHFDKEQEFTQAIRNSAIIIEGEEQRRTVAYPIENHVYQLDVKDQKAIIGELLEMQVTKRCEPRNFEEFLRMRFGQTLYDIYFQPYNSKIWRKSLDTIPLAWLEGKLPMPTTEEIIFNNFNHVKEKAFVHSTFYYPRSGGSQFIADRLAEGLDIRLGQAIDEITACDKQWKIGEELFDKVIFCGNIKQLPHLLPSALLPESYAAGIEQLEAHGTTAVFCSIDHNEFSWLYLPDRNHDSHRIICTGNFLPANNGDNSLTASIEFTDYMAKEEILAQLKRIPYAPKYLTHHYEKYTYPIQNADTRQLIANLKQHLATKEFYLLGRFAEWEYYNMDVAIHAAMQLNEKLSKEV